VAEPDDRRRDPFARRTADPATLLPWFAELGRTLPGLVRSYLPGGPIGARTRERVMLAVTEVNGCRYCAWIHGSWSDYLGERVEGGDAADDAEAAESALLLYARACADAGHPVYPSPLRAVLPDEAVEAVRATVAQIEVSNLVGNTVDGLLARLTRARPLDPPRAAMEVATVVAALPLAAPLLALSGAMRLVRRAAPPVPEVVTPPAGEANLLVHLLAQTVPAYLANAGVRLALLRLPLPLTIGIKAGRTSATLRIGRGQVEVDNGIADDAVVVLEGEVEPLLQLATGTLVRELSSLRIRPNG
jgi:AhpD family alkylhydroperoxidase